MFFTFGGGKKVMAIVDMGSGLKLLKTYISMDGQILILTAKQ